MFLILFRNILWPQQMFPGLRNMETQHSFCVARVCAPKKHHQQKCVRKNVSSFARAFRSTSTTLQMTVGSFNEGVTNDDDNSNHNATNQ